MYVCVHVQGKLKGGKEFFQGWFQLSKVPMYACMSCIYVWVWYIYVVSHALQQAHIYVCMCRL